MALVDCQVKVCALLFYHVFQGWYVAMHGIDLDGAERHIFHDLVDEHWMGGKP